MDTFFAWHFTDWSKLQPETSQLWEVFSLEKKQRAFSPIPSLSNNPSNNPNYSTCRITVSVVIPDKGCFSPGYAVTDAFPQWNTSKTCFEGKSFLSELLYNSDGSSSCSSQAGNHSKAPHAREEKVCRYSLMESVHRRTVLICALTMLSKRQFQNVDWRNLIWSDSEASTPTLCTMESVKRKPSPANCEQVLADMSCKERLFVFAQSFCFAQIPVFPGTLRKTHFAALICLVTKKPFLWRSSRHWFFVLERTPDNWI